jgi:hypothetical protein
MEALDHAASGGPDKTGKSVAEAVEARRGKKGHATPMRRQLRYWQPFNDWCVRADGRWWADRN